MDIKKLEEIYYSAYFLINFKKIREDKIVKNFLDFIKAVVFQEEIEKIFEKYSDFMYFLNLKRDKNFSTHIKNLVLNEKIDLDDKVEIEKEFVVLSSLAKINSLELKELLKSRYPEKAKIIDFMPVYNSNVITFSINELQERNLEEDIFKVNRTFLFNDKLEIQPIKILEKMDFKALKGYEKQKKILYNNTKSLLKGLKVNNILLYGDAGCGKSTSVRALLNEFDEIKIIQIFKDNLIHLDNLYLQLAKLPYKFIIFADDISFSDDDNTLSTTKAILDGALVQCPSNAVIYATSNRRHLIKESFQSREGDEIHLQDTINEISSLSERFGINLLFQKPSNEEFKEIVLAIAQDYNLELDNELIIQEAQKYALKKGTNSPRIAKQVINNMLANVKV